MRFRREFVNPMILFNPAHARALGRKGGWKISIGGGVDLPPSGLGKTIARQLLPNLSNTCLDDELVVSLRRLDGREHAGGRRHPLRQRAQ